MKLPTVTYRDYLDYSRYISPELQKKIESGELTADQAIAITKNDYEQERLKQTPVETLSTGLDTTPVKEEDPGFLSSAGSMLGSWIDRTQAKLGFSLADNGFQVKIPGGPSFNALDPGARPAIMDNVAKNLAQSREGEQVARRWSEGSDLKTAIMDVIQSPEMVIPMATTAAGAAIGGPAGAAAGSRIGAVIPAGSVFLDEYMEARLAGVSKEEATALAAAKAGTEYAVESLTARMGGFLKIADEAIAAGGKAAKPAVLNYFGKVMRASGSEGLQEAGTEAIQGGIDTAISAAKIGSGKLQEFSESQDFDSITDAGSRMYRAGFAGAVGGGAIRSVSAPFEIGNERSRAEAIRQQQEEAKRLQEAFDAEQEAIRKRAAADKANQELVESQRNRDYFSQDLKTGEMPFGSDLAGDPQQNDRTPTSQDMFSGESIPATKLEQRRAANESERNKGAQVYTEQEAREENARRIEAAKVQLPNTGKMVPASEAGERTINLVKAGDTKELGQPLKLTSEEMYAREVNEKEAKKGIELKQQDAFEQTKQQEMEKRRRLEEAKRILKDRRKILSSASIEREVEETLAKDIERVKSLPINQSGPGARNLPTLLANYIPRRRKALTEHIRNFRASYVRQAMDDLIADENSRKIEQPAIQEAERQEKTRLEEASTKMSAAQQAEMELGLPAEEGEQGELGLGTPDDKVTKSYVPPYKGSMTDEEASREAARLVAVRKNQKKAAKEITEAQEETLTPEQQEELLAMQQELGATQEEMEAARKVKQSETYYKLKTKAQQDSIKEAEKSLKDTGKPFTKEDVNRIAIKLYAPKLKELDAKYKDVLSKDELTKEKQRAQVAAERKANETKQANRKAKAEVKQEEKGVAKDVDFTNQPSRVADKEARGNLRLARDNGVAAKGAGLAKDVASKYLDAWMSQWKVKPKIELVTSFEELGFPEAGPTTRGAWVGDTIYFVLSGIQTPAQLKTVLLHEAVGHFGIELIVGRKEWADIIQSVKTSKEFDRIKKTLIDRGYDPTDDVEMAKETIAVMAEKGITNSLMDRLVSMFRAGFRKLFPGTPVSQAELRMYLVRAVRNLQSGDVTTPPTNRRLLSTSTAGTKASAVASDNFRKWFGNSKVVDKDGNPLVVYHGTTADFTSFKKSSKEPGIHFGTLDQAHHRRFLDKEDMHGRSLPPRIIPVYLSIQNPARVSDVFGGGVLFAAEGLYADGVISESEKAEIRDVYLKTRQDNATKSWDKIVDIVKSKGYDGFIYKNVGESKTKEAAQDSYVVFDATQIKSATGNNGEYSPTNEDIAFSKSTPKTKAAAIVEGFGGDSTLGKAVVDVLTADAGGKAWVSEILERAKGVSAVALRKGEVALGKINQELSQLSNNDKKAFEEIRADFEGMVAAIEEAEDVVTRTSAERALKKKYPSLSKAYEEARFAIDDYTRSLINSRLEDPREFTQQEYAIYQKMRNNIGKYYPRVYAARTPSIGKEWAKMLVDAWTKAKNKEALTLIEKKHADVVNGAIKWMMDKGLYIPADDKLVDIDSFTDLENIANRWGIPIPTDANSMEDRKEILKDALAAKRDSIGSKEMARRAEIVVMNILKNPSDDNYFVDYHRNSTLDRTILEARDNIPPEIRALLGEYTDLPMRMMLTLTQQGHLLATSNALQEIREQGLGVTVIPSEDFDQEDEGWMKAEGESWGALQNHRIRKDVYSKLAPIISMSQEMDTIFAAAASGDVTALAKEGISTGLEKLAKVLRIHKLTQLVLNPALTTWNYLSGPFIMFMNGNVAASTAKNILKAHAVAIKIIDLRGVTPASKLLGSVLPDVTEADVEEVLRSLQVDSALIGQWRNMEVSRLKELLHDGAGTLQSTKHKALTGIMKMTDTYAEVHGFSDVLWKIANYYHRKEQVEKVNKLEGSPLTPEQVERKAAFDNRMSNMSWERVPTIIKGLNKYGVAYLASYMWEVHRSIAGNFGVGLQDVLAANKATSPEAAQQLRRQGIARIAGSALSLGVAQSVAFSMAKFAAEALGLSDDEDEDSLKWLVPEWFRDSVLLPMGRTKDGRVSFFELSRLDPFGPLTSVMKELAKPDEEDSKLGEKLFDLYISNPATGGLVGYLATLARPGPAAAPESTLMQQYWPGAFDLLTDNDNGGATAHGIRYVEKSLLPSLLRSSLDTTNNPMPEGGGALRLFGMRAVTADPQAAIESQVYSYNAVNKAARTALRNKIMNSDNLTEDEVIRLYARVNDEMAREFKQLHRVYSAAKKVNQDDEYAAAQTLADTDLDKMDVAAVMYGDFRIAEDGFFTMRGLDQLAEDIQKDRKQTSRENKLKNIETVRSAIFKNNLPYRK